MSEDPSGDSRRARRRIARDHHPDRGGSTQVYLELLSQLDTAEEQRSTGVPVSVHRSPAGRVASWLRVIGTGTRRLRAALPTHLPGSRRYGNLS